MYVYVHNNPVNFVDPTGHKEAEGIQSDSGGVQGGVYSETADESPSDNRAREIRSCQLLKEQEPDWYSSPGAAIGCKMLLGEVGEGDKVFAFYAGADGVMAFAGGLIWTSYSFKHIAPKNVAWKDVIESTKAGVAKYLPGTDVQVLEMKVWQEGIPVTNGKPWKVMQFDRVIGANGGVETQYVRVELSGNTIHGHPITKEEFLRLTKP